MLFFYVALGLLIFLLLAGLVMLAGRA